MPKVFVVEDDAALRGELLHILGIQGFECATTDRFAAAVEDILAYDADCVVLDLKLPEVSGFDICRDLRKKSQVPVIMLTSSDSEFDELMSMNLGADDYVTKPYNPAILVARIQSVLRRTHTQAPPARITHNGLTLDLARGCVSSKDQTVELTRNELKILALLMENHDTIISRQEIMNELWQSDEFIDDNTLTVNINRLRKSLADIGVVDYLSTRRGQGYIV
ncbi:MAG: response regulator transcription factor [Raoultibacter sp.]